ncbi:bacteriohemerythrin [Zhaonella formicivorans]|uniref:bacteriohemerythrin n=1 Tax=Zhaonella formicivorans TaxID=2528593 RepID=UPI0010DDC412|nr:hemerythrin family protein [Zhaonella formicivorans]
MWKESYCIGVEKVDAQHKELFQRVTDFLQALKGPGQWPDKVEKVKETLSFMQSYVIEHFADEEIYQKEINYPDLDKHCQIHEDFKRDVGKYAEKLTATNYAEEVALEFGGKLMAWLIYHVAKEDQRIGEYVRTSAMGGLSHEG